MNRGVAVVLLIISLVFVGLGGVMLARGEAGDRAMAAACMAFFGGCALTFAGAMLPMPAPAPDSDGVTTIRNDRLRNAMLMAAGASMGAAMPLILSGDRAWMGIAGGALFGLAGIVGMIRLWRPAVLLRAETDALVDPNRGWRIRWREIEDIAVDGAAGTYWLSLRLDPRTPVDRSLRRDRRTGAVRVPVVGAALTPEQLVHVVMHYWRRHRGA